MIIPLFCPSFSYFYIWIRFSILSNTFVWFLFIEVNNNETTATIDGLYPTATFQIKVVANGDLEQYGIQPSCSPYYFPINKLSIEDSEDSQIIFADTNVASCEPKRKSCCFTF